MPQPQRPAVSVSCASKPAWRILLPGLPDDVVVPKPVFLNHEPVQKLRDSSGACANVRLRIHP